MDASIQARDKADKLAKRRQRQIIGGLTGGIVIFQWYLYCNSDNCKELLSMKLMLLIIQQKHY